MVSLPAWSKAMFYTVWSENACMRNSQSVRTKFQSLFSRIVKAGSHQILTHNIQTFFQNDAFVSYMTVMKRGWTQGPPLPITFWHCTYMSLNLNMIQIINCTLDISSRIQTLQDSPTLTLAQPLSLDMYKIKLMIFTLLPQNLFLFPSQ